MLYVAGRHQQSVDSLPCFRVERWDTVIVPRNGVDNSVVVVPGDAPSRMTRRYSTIPHSMASLCLRHVVRPSRIIPPRPLSFRRFTSSPYTPEPTSNFRRAAYGALFALTAAVGVVYYFDSRAAIHRYLITPLIRNTLDPESAHKLAVNVLENGLGPRDMLPDDDRLEMEVKVQCLINRNRRFMVFSSGVEHYQTPLVSQLDLTKTVEQLMV